VFCPSDTMKLHRYWIEFSISFEAAHPPGILAGCGVTAYNIDDALMIIKRKVFGNEDLPPIRQIAEDVDISTLDPGHVLPNMAVPTWRGVWFPRGFE
jgi:hypothetical protein